MSQSFFLVVTLYLIVTVVKGQQVDCTHLATLGNCDFYRHCVETRLQCGENGYPLAFGDRYCRRFTEESPCFTLNQGQDWIQNTRICLMVAILNNQVYQSSGTCNELETFAFANHPTCYTDNGFCSDILLSFDDLRCIANNVLNEMDSIRNRQAFQQVFNAATRCTKQAADSFLSLVDDWISSTADQSVIRNLLQNLKDLLGGCENGLDIILVLDSSGSVGSSDFELMTDFIADELIPNFNIGADDTRVGVIRFSSGATTEIPLGSINDAALLQNSIRNIGFIGGGTATHLALNLLNSAYDGALNRRTQGIPKVAIVFTDGQSNSRSATVQAAQLVHDAGIVVYSFGIGSGIDDTELNTIASSAENIFQIAGFSSSEFANILLQLETSACTTPTPTSISEPLETSLRTGQSRILQYSFSPEEGMTLKMDVFNGEVQVFGSFTIRNPTSLTADFIVQSSSGIDFFISQKLYLSSTGGASLASRRRRRQTDDVNVYMSITGLSDNNTFALNTTFGDTSTGSECQTDLQCSGNRHCETSLNGNRLCVCNDGLGGEDCEACPTTGTNSCQNKLKMLFCQYLNITTSSYDDVPQACQELLND